MEFLIICKSIIYFENKKFENCCFNDINIYFLYGKDVGYYLGVDNIGFIIIIIYNYKFLFFLK